MDRHSALFIDALNRRDLEAVRKIPKSDLHNHFVLGGSRRFLQEKTGYDIRPFDGVLQSMQEMHAWNEANLGERFNSTNMRRLLIEAAFVQAREDGVTVLEIGEDVWGLRALFENDVGLLIDAFEEPHHRIAPEMELRLQIGLSRHCPVDYLLDCLEPFWGRSEFCSIDLYGDELAQPIDNFAPIYRRAKERGLRLKAHIGEWGTAEDIEHGVKVLALDEIQHGIAAAQSERLMDFLAERQIRLNLTPTSNVKLGRVAAMEEHPIRALLDAGIDVTINSDDVLIFDSDVSKEYIRLMESGVLKAEALDRIRLQGLKRLPST